jgi:hypothetical protein
MVMATAEGLLLKPSALFEPTTLGDVAGLPRDRVATGVSGSAVLPRYRCTDTQPGHFSSRFTAA